MTAAPPFPELAGATIVHAERGRGTQLRSGAEAAAGDWLLFLHADTILASGWRRVVDRHIAEHDGAACFRFRLASTSRQARLIEAAVAARVRLFGLAYGDQGLLISRSLYDRIGGYRSIPLMEDVDIARRIGRRRLHLLEAEASTSAARWQRDGWLRRSARNLVILACYRLGVPPARLAEYYERGRV